MLVLSRSNREEILVGDSIRITVLDIRKGRVCLGLEAPKNIHIARRELLEGLPENEGISDVQRRLAGCVGIVEPGSAA